MKNLFKIKHKNIFIIIGYIAICLYFITSIISNFRLDESFTFALINHSFGQLINLDVMDVHPPLYYLILKIFLLVTTFWTRSIFVKIIFARLLSIGAFIIFIIYARRILTDCCNTIKLGSQLLIYLLFPIIFIKLTTIRMYSISALFLLLEFYYLLKLKNTNKNIYLINILLFSILSAYTFYFAAISSGTLLIILLVENLYAKKYKLSLKIFSLGILLIASYIPWIPFILKQFKYHINNDNGTSNSVLQKIQDVLSSFTQLGTVGFANFIFEIIISIILIMLIIYSFQFNNTKFNYLLKVSLINFVVTLIISLIICNNKFQMGALYPSFTFYSFLLSGVIVQVLSNRYNVSIICKDAVIFMMILFVTFSYTESYKNIKNNDLPVIAIEQNINRWKHYNTPNIIINARNFNNNRELNISTYAIYLSSINKNEIVKHENPYKLSAGLVKDNNELKLIRKTFNNLYVDK